MHKDITRYIGAPYKSGGTSLEDGVDCYSLVKIFLKNEYGIDLPNCNHFSHQSEADRNKMVTSGLQNADGWVIIPYDKFHDGDIILAGNKFFHHIGVVVGNKILHAVSSSSGGQVCTQCVHRFIRVFPKIQFMRKVS